MDLSSYYRETQTAAERDDAARRADYRCGMPDPPIEFDRTSGASLILPGCGCDIVGRGTSPYPLRIKFCAVHQRVAQPKKKRRDFLCAQCGAVTYDDYMVADEVWLEVAGKLDVLHLEIVADGPGQRGVHLSAHVDGPCPVCGDRRRLTPRSVALCPNGHESAPPIVQCRVERRPPVIDATLAECDRCDEHRLCVSYQNSARSMRSTLCGVCLERLTAALATERVKRGMT